MTSIEYSDTSAYSNKEYTFSELDSSFNYGENESDNDGGDESYVDSNIDVNNSREQEESPMLELSPEFSDTRQVNQVSLIKSEIDTFEQSLGLPNSCNEELTDIETELASGPKYCTSDNNEIHYKTTKVPKPAYQTNVNNNGSEDPQEDYISHLSVPENSEYLSGETKLDSHNHVNEGKNLKLRFDASMLNSYTMYPESSAQRMNPQRSPKVRSSPHRLSIPQFKAQRQWGPNKQNDASNMRNAGLLLELGTPTMHPPTPGTPGTPRIPLLPRPLVQRQYSSHYNVKDSDSTIEDNSQEDFNQFDPMLRMNNKRNSIIPPIDYRYTASPASLNRTSEYYSPLQTPLQSSSACDSQLYSTDMGLSSPALSGATLPPMERLSSDPWRFSPLKQQKKLINYESSSKRLRPLPCKSNDMNVDLLFLSDEQFRAHICFTYNIRSINKMPLSVLYDIMGVSEDPLAGRYHEENIMQLLANQGFRVGSQTWVRDTDIFDRKRIVNEIFAKSAHLGYSKRLIDVVVRRGTYARMQAQLRHLRRKSRGHKGKSNIDCDCEEYNYPHNPLTSESNGM